MYCNDPKSLTDRSRQTMYCYTVMIPSFLTDKSLGKQCTVVIPSFLTDKSRQTMYCNGPKCSDRQVQANNVLK